MAAHGDIAAVSSSVAIGGSSQPASIDAALIGALEGEGVVHSEQHSNDRAKADHVVDDTILECAICLQPCVHPVRLPCKHIFCFLCMKGVAGHSRRCALCRAEIPEEFVRRPALIQSDALSTKREERQPVAGEARYHWYYEGVGGWWEYDERTSVELENRHQEHEANKSPATSVFDIVIAGFIYVIDLDNGIQFRKGHPRRRRRIKRDLADIPDFKGVAGLKCPRKSPAAAETRLECEGGDDCAQLAAAAAPSAAGASAGNPVNATGMQQSVARHVGNGADSSASNVMQPRRDRASPSSSSYSHHSGHQNRTMLDGRSLDPSALGNRSRQPSAAAAAAAAPGGRPAATGSPSRPHSSSSSRLGSGRLPPSNGRNGLDLAVESVTRNMTFLNVAAADANEGGVGLRQRRAPPSSSQNVERSDNVHEPRM